MPISPLQTRVAHHVLLSPDSSSRLDYPTVPINLAETKSVWDCLSIKLILFVGRFRPERPSHYEVSAVAGWQDRKWRVLGL
jgi:hypothetical protein